MEIQPFTINVYTTTYYKRDANAIIDDVRDVQSTFYYKMIPIL